MGEEQVGVAITREDLAQLAQVNPLAWEQLLHIADMRQANERIEELEAELSDLRVDNLFADNEAMRPRIPQIPDMVVQSE